MLAAFQRGLDHREPWARMRRQVDHGNVVALKRASDVVRRLGVGEELVTPGFRPGESPVADDGDVEAGRPVGAEMGGGNTAGADERYPRPIGAWHWRPVGQIRRGDLGRLGALQAVGVEIRLLAHGTRATVRFSWEDRTALSIILCPSGPLIGAPSSIRASMYSIGPRRPGGSWSTGISVWAVTLRVCRVT